MLGPLLSIVVIRRNIDQCRERDRKDCDIQSAGSVFAFPILVLDTILQAGGLYVVASEVLSPSGKVKSRARRSVSVRPYASGSMLGVSGTF